MMKDLYEITFERADFEFLQEHLTDERVMLLRDRSSPAPRSTKKVVVKLEPIEIDQIVEEIGDTLIACGFDNKWTPTPLGLKLEKMIDILTSAFGNGRFGENDC